MKRVFYLLALLWFSAQLHAQFSVSGKITGKDSEPLTGANILIKGTYKGTTSDMNGEFRLSNLKAGSYFLIISFIGYENIEKEVKVSDDTHIDIMLNPSVLMGDEVIVKGTRAGNKTPMSYVNVNKDEISEKNFGQDLPVMLNQLTSIVTSTDAGNGVGYTGLRIRGTDINRINVTINGVPYNDPESHGVYWVDLPDFASSTDNIQIQRGVGTSSNGAAAFGATINLQTNKLNPDPFAEADVAYGSFNTLKTNVTFGSGLLKNKFTLDGRLSKISSDGYIDRAWADLKSFYLSGGYYTGKSIIRLYVFSGLEETYQSWNGVPKVRLDNDLAGMQRYEDDWLFTHEETQHMINSDSRTYNYFTYKNQIDHYRQNHYQLHFSQQITDALLLNTALFYTKGAGYYEEYKTDEDLADYNITYITEGNEEITNSDIVRRKWLDNDFYGFTGNMIFSGQNFDMTWGGGWNTYNCDHFGKVIWAGYSDGSEIDHEWYRNKGMKHDFNIYLKTNLALTGYLNLFGDLQYRGIRYSINGTEDDRTDTISMKGMDFDFFNPKGGLFVTLDDFNSAYVSFSVANREPNRSNYVDAPNGKLPSSETLYDLEFGYKINLRNVKATVNFYNMNYKDQLVLTGEINDVGGAIMVNVPNSYHRGIELSMEIILTKFLNWSGNLTLSRNKIKHFTEYVDNANAWFDEEQPLQVSKYLGKTDISFSPEITGASVLSIEPVKKLRISLSGKYVGRQYIDNTSSHDRSLDPYFVNNLFLNYSMKFKSIKEIKFRLLVNNVFNKKYETNAWVWRYYLGNEYYEMDGYFPQAGINIQAGLSLRL